VGRTHEQVRELSYLQRKGVLEDSCEEGRSRGSEEVARLGHGGKGTYALKTEVGNTFLEESGSLGLAKGRGVADLGKDCKALGSDAADSCERMRLLGGGRREGTGGGGKCFDTKGHPQGQSIS